MRAKRMTPISFKTSRVLAFLAACLVAHVCLGDASGVLPEGFHSAHGSLSHQVAIAVPAFHGMNPGVSLSYNSSGGNSIVGVGWSISGFSTIERKSARKTYPTYTTTDIYLLDGEPLLPCST